ncbi:MAG TPA: histidine kinase dimerization/phosphoacceptor domain -containing protein [Puia sp.]|nr:histidine kinase dimerization/phosphoacceptor domain -containing protein [Puia sp.]
MRFSVICRKLFPFWFIFAGFPAHAQKTTGGLGADNYYDFAPLPILIRDSRSAKPDTAKVDTLFVISKMYWARRFDGDLDSCISFAREAHLLSAALHDTERNNNAIAIMCKAMTKKDDMPSAIALLGGVYGEEKVRILLIIAERYVNFQPVVPAYLEKARPYIVNALQLSDSLRSVRWKHESLMLAGKYYFEGGDFAKGKGSIMEIIEDCKRTGDLNTEAHYWAELDKYMPETDSTYPDHVFSNRMAFQLYMKANNKREAVFVLRDRALLNIDCNHNDSAEQELTQVFSMFDDLKLTPTYTTDDAASRLYLLKGDLNRSLFYDFKALGTVTGPDDKRLITVYARIGYIYDVQGNISVGLPYLRKAFTLAVAYNEPEDMYRIAGEIVHDEVALGNGKSALEFLLTLTRQHPPGLTEQKEALASLFGFVYNALGEYGMAEQYYLQMIDLDKAMAPQLQRSIFRVPYIRYDEPFYAIGRFYTMRKRYGEAKPYLEKALALRHNGRGVVEGDIELCLFEGDSAMGNYKPAMAHYIRYKAINDSIYNVAKVKELADMQVKYETDQKEQSIRLLQSQSQIQRQTNQAELQRANTQRNITLAGVAALLIISGLTFLAYRNKQRTNRQLRRQQAQINEQNGVLTGLVSDKTQLLMEKDKLLNDKDLLLKEVHHRVKNNLHLVISLLESQAAYLKNSAALEAILESQNRVRAIALIHQKLYSAENVMQVDMAAYIPELIDYLNESFHTKKHDISIVHAVEGIRLDVSQAIPVGIILNEAITNAIKYAFPACNRGKIAVSMKLQCRPGGGKTEGRAIRVTICDNGSGLPRDFDIHAIHSMGMTLMFGLSRHLQGDLSITNEPGVRIMLEFPFDPQPATPVELSELS